MTLKKLFQQLPLAGSVRLVVRTVDFDISLLLKGFHKPRFDPEIELIKILHSSFLIYAIMVVCIWLGPFNPLLL